jgi:hypothetical protein
MPICAENRYDTAPEARPSPKDGRGDRGGNQGRRPPSLLLPGSSSNGSRRWSGSGTPPASTPG